MKGLQRKKLRTAAVAAAFTLMAGLGGLALQDEAEAAGKIYEGTLYSATRGGHMVFTTITIDGGRDMVSGTIAGRLELPNNNGADAIELSPDQKTIYYPTWDSTLYTIDISGAAPKIIGEKKWMAEETKSCGSHFGPDGKLYVTSMSFGDIHKLDVSDPKNPKLMDRQYKTTYLCGVQVTANGNEVWTTDMKDSAIYVYDAKSHKLQNKIDIGDEFLHRSRWSPNGKRLYQASTGSKTPDANGNFRIVDAASKKITDKIVLGPNYDIHDVMLTPDEKYAIAVVRRVPAKEYKDSEYVVVNLETKKTIGVISMCKSCHTALGVDPEIKPGREVFICGGQVAWKK